MSIDVLIKASHIAKAKQILSGEWRYVASVELFEYLEFEDTEWFYSRFPDGGHDGYIAAVIALAESELLRN